MERLRDIERLMTAAAAKGRSDPTPHHRPRRPQDAYRRPIKKSRYKTINHTRRCWPHDRSAGQPADFAIDMLAPSYLFSPFFFPFCFSWEGCCRWFLSRNTSLHFFVVGKAIFFCSVVLSFRRLDAAFDVATSWWWTFPSVPFSQVNKSQHGFDQQKKKEKEIGSKKSVIDSLGLIMRSSKWRPYLKELSKRCRQRHPFFLQQTPNELNLIRTAAFASVSMSIISGRVLEVIRHFWLESQPTDSLCSLDDDTRDLPLYPPAVCCWWA